MRVRARSLAELCCLESTSLYFGHNTWEPNLISDMVECVRHLTSVQVRMKRSPPWSMARTAPSSMNVWSFPEPHAPRLREENVRGTRIGMYTNSTLRCLKEMIFLSAQSFSLRRAAYALEVRVRGVCCTGPYSGVASASSILAHALPNIEGSGIYPLGNSRS